MKRAIILMYDSLNRHMLPPYGDTVVNAPNFARLAAKAVTFDNFYAGSMPCIPARRELHTGRYNFMHRSWGPLEPYDDSMPQILKDHGIYTHLVSDHPHYWEDGGATFHTRYSSWEFFRGQEGDPWKANIGLFRQQEDGPNNGIPIVKHDAVNRTYMPTEADHAQTRTVDAGMEFLETNVNEDNWMLQLELFDPHEPFFVPQAYRDLYGQEPNDDQMDWPPYEKVNESKELVESVRLQYAALVSMCDHSLGRVLDFMDEHDMWKDTLLFVNTDHGFLLGEHGWWAKSVQPWFNELVHLPLFMWDPRTGGKDTRRGALAQTIDIAPTMLKYFGLEPTKDMEGHDLAQVLANGTESTATGTQPTADTTDASIHQIHEGALFGIHGGHVNVTDGRYVYMRAAKDPSNLPLDEFTLMPTHMRMRFSPQELANWEPAEPFSFTKNTRVMRIPTQSIWMNPWRYGTLLYDLETDPGQHHPIDDPEVELRMLRLLAKLMHEGDAPESLFQRLGIPFEGEINETHLLVHEQKDRAEEIAEPIPLDINKEPLVHKPLAELEDDLVTRPIIEHYIPSWTHTELVAVPPQLSLLDLVKTAIIPVDVLQAICEDVKNANR